MFRGKRRAGFYEKEIFTLFKKIPSGLMFRSSFDQGNQAEEKQTLGIKKMLDPENGTPISEVREVMTSLEMLEEYPEAFTSSEKEAVRMVVQEYQQEMAALWASAKANKGHLNDFVFRGEGKLEKNKRKVIDPARIDKAIAYGYNKAIYNGKSYYHANWSNLDLETGKIDKNDKTDFVSYTDCGPTVAGFILDFIHANRLENLRTWDSLSWGHRVDSLALKMIGKTTVFYEEENVNLANPGYSPRIEYKGDTALREVKTKSKSVDKKGDKKQNSSITMPRHLDNAIKDYSRYKVVLAFGMIPKNSIKANRPGISLRGLKKDSKAYHYRNVIGYQEKGWSIFHTDYIKIYDGNNIDRKKVADDAWEAYNLVYHAFSFNLVVE